MDSDDLDPTVLGISNRRSETRRRYLIMVVLLALFALAAWAKEQARVLGLGGDQVALAAFVLAIALAWQLGVVLRLKALVHLKKIRRAQDEVSERLESGQFAEARRQLLPLLVRARALGPFHALHLVIYAILEFLDRRATHAEALFERVFASGWLDSPGLAGVRVRAATWWTFVRLQLGKVEQAEQLLRNHETLPVAQLAVRSAQKRWRDVYDRAREELELAGPSSTNAKLPQPELSSIALLGKRAAEQLGQDSTEFSKLLVERPLSPVARANPALFDRSSDEPGVAS